VSLPSSMLPPVPLDGPVELAEWLDDAVTDAVEEDVPPEPVVSESPPHPPT